MSSLAKNFAAFIIAALLVALPASAAPPQASAAQTCSVSGKERKLGASYVTKLSTRRVSCRDARNLSILYHRCRRAHGGKDGRCTRVRGFRCSERRYNKIDISYDSNVVCNRGSQRMRQTYTQLT